MSDNMTLSSDNESFINQQVSLGVFRNRTEAIESGVELLRKRQELFDLLDQRRQQIDDGDVVEFDREGLRLFFEGLKLRARRAAETK